MNGKKFPPLVGVKVTVKIPDGLPKLMYDVTREVLRHQPEDEQSAYSLVADYLECLLKKRGEKGDSMNLQINLIDELINSGYTIEELNKLAIVIQSWWRYYKNMVGQRGAKEGLGINDHVLTKSITDILKKYDISLKTANVFVIKIQRAWRRYLKSVLKSMFKKQFEAESLEELDYENISIRENLSDLSDDSERVNVVKKSQRYYVPPIPDFIDDDFDSYKDETENTNNI